MTDLIYDYITLGVDMIISAAILASIVLLLRTSTLLSMYSAQQQATSDKLNYYREFSMYDCTNNLTGADVLSALTYYRYDLDIVVTLSGGSAYYTVYNDRSNGKYYIKTNNGNPVECDYAYVSNIINSTYTFGANLAENYNNINNGGALSTSGYTGGVVSGIKFNGVKH